MNSQKNKKEKPKISIKLGMRVVKTILASFICMVIDYFRGEVPFQTVITAAICIQPDAEETISSGIMRTIGTMIGALYGVAVIFIFDFFNIEINRLLYYFILCLLMVPLVTILGILKSSNGFIVSVVLFLSITITRHTGDDTWSFIFNRILDTLIGIFVAIPVDLLLPHKAREKDEEKKFDLSKISALDIGENLEKLKKKKNKNNCDDKVDEKKDSKD